MTWHKEAINAFLLDDPSKDVDPNRASRKSLSTLKKIFAIKTSKKSSWAKKDKTEEYDLVTYIIQFNTYPTPQYVFLFF